MISIPGKQTEPGRNDDCPCGSGKKYKKCCLLKKEFLEQKPGLTTMLKLLYCFVKGLKGSELIITKRTLDAMPEDWQEKMKIKPAMNKELLCYVVSVEKEEEPKIKMRAPKLWLPGDNPN